MAQKSKTQRAKRSAVRAAKKEQTALEAVQAEAEGLTDSAQAADSEESKKKPSKKSEKSSDSAAEAQSAKKDKEKDKEKPKKTKKPGFFSQVRAELKRVTWPTKSEVFRWSGVVIAALLFFGVFVLILDNLIVTPLLVAISGLSDSSLSLSDLASKVLSKVSSFFSGLGA